MARFSFDLQARDGNARAGVLEFHNAGMAATEIHSAGMASYGNPQRENPSAPQELIVETPVFMPVGTRGTVKALSQQDLEELGYNLILGNTYHLYLRPGTKVLNDFGGLKNFMSWPRALLTDSGGYQAFSLSKLTKYRDDGVLFRSHIDGSAHLFSPSSVLDIQAAIGSDIVMPIDDCAPYPADSARLRESLKRTHDWLRASKEYWQKSGYDKTQSLFGIVQGGADASLRIESAEYCAALDLPGYSIGGISVGEKNEEFRGALNAALSALPQEKPRYLMGVGSIPEILDAVAAGVDMFDCVLPTRNARNGQVFTSTGKVNLRNEKHASDTRPIDEACECKICRRYSVGYIRHLHKTQELLAYSLSTYHNLYFMKKFMADMRIAIQAGNFEDYYSEWMAVY